MPHILIVEDDPDVAQTVQLALNRAAASGDLETADTAYPSAPNFSAQIATSGQQALDLLQSSGADLILLDISMPGMDGYQVCRLIRALPGLLSSVPIIFLTARGQDQDRIEGFRAGADDYIGKPFNLQELILRIRAVLRRSQPAPTSRQLRVGDLTLDTDTYQVRTPIHTILLTPTEYDLLHHLMTHAGQIFSSESLLLQVWRFPPGTGNTDLVRAHVKNLRDKIEPHPRQPIYLRTIPRHGYVVGSRVLTQE